MTTNLEQKLRDPVFLNLVSQLRKQRQTANEMHTKVNPIVQDVFNRYSFSMMWKTVQGS
jgi:hypothetical protein